MGVHKTQSMSFQASQLQDTIVVVVTVELAVSVVVPRYPEQWWEWAELPSIAFSASGSTAHSITTTTTTTMKTSIMYNHHSNYN